MGEMEPLRMGIFGVGRMGRVHLENLLRMAREGTIELVALGDRLDSVRSAAFAAVNEEMGPGPAPRPARFDDPGEMAAALRWTGWWWRRAPRTTPPTAGPSPAGAFP